jgi:hypothetical protein
MTESTTRPDAQSVTDPATGLLLLFLRSPWDAEALPAAQVLVQDVDGSALARLALEQGIAPLLYSYLRQQHLVPAAVEATLGQAYYASAARNARLFRELESILGQLAAADIAVVLLKGAALGPGVYGNPALRPMADLDLLVRAQDASAAQQALAAGGYRASQHEPAPGAIAAYSNEVRLHNGQTPGVSLELHWGLLDSPYYQRHLSMDWFWQTTRPLVIGRVTACTLGPEAQVTHLCAHQVLHHPSPAPRLLWLHDVAEVITHFQEQIDWGGLLAHAQENDLVLPLQQVLPLIGREWRAPIPATVLDNLSRLQPSARERQVFAQLTAPHRPAGRRFWQDLASLSSWPRRLHLAWISVFPTPAYMRQRYHISHSLLLSLYYPYRWLRGARDLLLPWRS